MAKNILLISVDQWRGDCLGFLGHDHVQTPNLDAFAADATVFRHHYSVAAPCGPARASLLTGLYPFNHRSIRNGTPLDRRHTNIALELRKAGYDPVLFGYTDSSADPRDLPPGDPRLTSYEGVLPGFRQLATQLDDAPNSWYRQLEKKGYTVPKPSTDIWRRGDKEAEILPFTNQPAIYTPEDSDSAYITDSVIDYLARNGDESWFIHAVYLRPHPPLIAPAPYNAMHDPADMPLPNRHDDPADEAAGHPFIQALHKITDSPGYFEAQLNTFRASEDELRAMRAVYFGMISEVDFQFGRLIDYLKAQQLLDDTLIIFTCDHGEELGDHWLWGKGGFYEGAYHIPLIIRLPGEAGKAGRGQVYEDFTESVDVVPTILDCLDLDIPHTFDGRSLHPHLLGTPPQQWRDSIYVEFDFREPQQRIAETALNLESDQCSLCFLRSRTHKYVHFSALPPLLFDLQADPHEMRPVPLSADTATVFADHAGRLLSHRMIHADRSLANHMLTPDGVFHHNGPRIRI